MLCYGWNKKNLAGKKADFKIKIINVYKREIPKTNDNFAKNMGFENINKLKEQIENNIKKDKTN